MIAFSVRGMPGTKGSARAFVTNKGRAVITNDSKKAAPWAALVKHAAAEAMGERKPLAGALEVGVTFWLPRPRGHYLPVNGKRPEPVLRQDAPLFVGTKPDGDKLLRCAWDALTEIVFRDDCQIVKWTGQKLYADPEPVGALFTITEADRG